MNTTTILCICLLCLVENSFASQSYRQSYNSISAETENVREVPERAREAPKSAKLLLVQILFRHGDRAPVFAYKNNPNNGSYWVEGYEKLTKLGRKQHYALGKYLHNRYKDFSTFTPMEVEVTSTVYDRTLASAESHLAGLFTPPKEWRINEDLNWQPIPIHMKPKAEDRFLLPSYACKRASQEEDAIFLTRWGQDYLKQHEETFRQISKHAGEKNLGINVVSGIFDTIRIEKKHGLIVPDWIEPFWEEMTQVTDDLYSIWFKTPLLKRLRTGSFIKLIIENMKKKMDGEQPNLKFHVYSAHDQTVTMALTSLDVFNKRQPPYCATILFELHGMTDGTQAMRLLYLNSTEPEKKIETPHVFTIPGCSEFCPIDYIIEYVQDIVLDGHEFNKECEVKDSLRK